MTAIVYGHVESAVQAWLAGTAVAPLVQRSAGVYSIYLAMPPAAPNPAIILRLIGGGPRARKDLPETRYGVSFTCYGRSRDEASLIARTLAGELINLGVPGVIAAGVYLGAAEITGMHWFPDPDSDTPRYIVDALITTVA